MRLESTCLATQVSSGSTVRLKKEESSNVKFVKNVRGGFIIRVNNDRFFVSNKYRGNFGK